MPTLQPAVHHALEEAYPAPLQCRQKAEACLQARRGSAGAHLPEHLLRGPTKTWGWGGHSCTADALKRVILCISPECEIKIIVLNIIIICILRSTPRNNSSDPSIRIKYRPISLIITVNSSSRTTLRLAFAYSGQGKLAACLLQVHA